MELLKLIQSFSNPVLDMTFLFITKIGFEIIGVIAALILLWCHNKNKGYKLLFSICTSLSINNIIKYTVKIKRPIGIEGIRNLEDAQGYSFPSGHSQITSTVMTFFSNELKKRWFYILSGIIILIIAISRLYLGVHWPADVIVGIILGIAFLFLSNYIFDRFIVNINLLSLIITDLILISSLFLFPYKDYIKVIGALSALLIGYYIDSTYIKFNPKSYKLSTNIIKVLIGLLVCGIIYVIFKKVVHYEAIRNFLTYFTIVTWATIVFPLTFSRSKSKITRVFN